MADTCSSALYDGPLHTPTSQRKNVYHVDVHVQVSSSIPFLGLLMTVYLGSHSSFMHLIFNCMALTSFGMLTPSSSEIILTLDPQHRLHPRG
jgi:hypothetical protein